MARPSPPADRASLLGFERMPPELLPEIASHLPLDGLGRMMACSKELNATLRCAPQWKRAVDALGRANALHMCSCEDADGNPHPIMSCSEVEEADKAQHLAMWGFDDHVHRDPRLDYFLATDLLATESESDDACELPCSECKCSAAGSEPEPQDSECSTEPAAGPAGPAPSDRHPIIVGDDGEGEKCVWFWYPRYQSMTPYEQFCELLPFCQACVTNIREHAALLKSGEENCMGWEFYNNGDDPYYPLQESYESRCNLLINLAVLDCARSDCAYGGEFYGGEFAGLNADERWPWDGGARGGSYFRNVFQDCGNFNRPDDIASLRAFVYGSDEYVKGFLDLCNEAVDVKDWDLFGDKLRTSLDPLGWARDPIHLAELLAAFPGPPGHRGGARGGTTGGAAGGTGTHMQLRPRPGR